MRVGARDPALRYSGELHTKSSRPWLRRPPRSTRWSTRGSIANDPLHVLACGPRSARLPCSAHGPRDPAPADPVCRLGIRFACFPITRSNRGLEGLARTPRFMRRDLGSRPFGRGHDHGVDVLDPVACSSHVRRHRGVPLVGTHLRFEVGGCLTRDGARTTKSVGERASNFHSRTMSARMRQEVIGLRGARRSQELDWPD